MVEVSQFVWTVVYVAKFSISESDHPYLKMLFSFHRVSLQTNGFFTLCTTEKWESTFLSELLQVPGVRAFISFHGSMPVCFERQREQDVL